MAKKLMNEKQFESFIHTLVKESLNTLSGYMPQERRNSEAPSSDSIDGKKEGESEKEKKIRMSVEKQLKQPGINIAAYGYKEYNGGISMDSNGDDNEKKNARKWIADRVNHAPDSNGNPQYFSPEEAIKLYNDLSGGINNISENRIKLNEAELNYIIKECSKRILQMIL